MRTSDWRAVIDAAIGPATEYLDSLPTRRVLPSVSSPDDIRQLLGGPVPEEGTDPVEVVATLARDLEPLVTSHACGRFFGFVIGGLHPAAYGADLLSVTWDQNAGLFHVTPGVAALEEISAAWLLDLLDLPAESSVGFVTGGQMATFTALAAARDHVLGEAGWDVRADGLPGAPRVNVVLKTDSHSTVPRALRYLGLGESNSIKVTCDDQGRIEPEALDETLVGLTGPTIVCVEAANINTGSFDPFGDVADVVDRHRGRGNPAWVHVDGAIGLLARVSPGRRHLTAGMERMDSWSTDAHKLLNVGYDSGIAITRHPTAHYSATSVQAPYLIQSEGDTRDPLDWVPEFSRRARGVAIYSTLRSLGRAGVVDLVDRTHEMAKLFATRLRDSGRAEVLNDVVFNQVLVRWKAPDGDSSAFNDLVMKRAQEEGKVFFSGTTVDGERLMRISVSDWATDEEDVGLAVETLLAHAAAADTAV
jgi:glutamate/tyrosine decarboxylase-like PLP-dependent enzyme